jgi:hypothetical protein
MPTDWFESNVNELVSGRILKVVAEFWEKNACPLLSLPEGQEAGF